jgi:hypothetical protein
MPLLLLLFIPVAIGLLFFGLYPWTSAEVAREPAVRAKAIYLNVPFFLVRAVFFFAIWIGIVWLMNRWAAILNERDDFDAARRLNYLGSFGIILYAFTGTYALIDWAMSLDPTWYSSIFALLGLVSQALTAMALMLVLLSLLAGDLPLVRMIPPGFFRDLGNLLLMALMLWAYMSFSQYLLTFTGDSVEEISWYVRRREGVWGVLSILLIAGHFFLPFMVLVVASNIKRDPNKLAKVAAFILVMRLVDLFWWVTPGFGPYRLAGVFADVGCPLLLGGIWLWCWAWQMKRHDAPVVPLRDPRLEGVWGQVVEHG